MEEKEIKNVLQLFLLSQSMIHQVDNISDKVLFKQEFKRRTNSYQSYLEKHINTLTKNMDIKESQYYVELVAKIDSVVESAEIVAKTIAELTDVKRTMPLIIKVCNKNKISVDHILKVGGWMKY